MTYPAEFDRMPGRECTLQIRATASAYSTSTPSDWITAGEIMDADEPSSLATFEVVTRAARVANKYPTHRNVSTTFDLAPVVGSTVAALLHAAHAAMLPLDIRLVDGPITAGTPYTRWMANVEKCDKKKSLNDALKYSVELSKTGVANPAAGQNDIVEGVLA